MATLADLNLGYQLTKLQVDSGFPTLILDIQKALEATL
jgi:hypothetical protein